MTTSELASNLGGPTSKTRGEPKGEQYLQRMDQSQLSTLKEIERARANTGRPPPPDSRRPTVELQTFCRRCRWTQHLSIDSNSERTVELLVQLPSVLDPDTTAQAQSFHLWPLKIRFFSSGTHHKVSSLDHQLRASLVEVRGQRWLGDKVLGPTEQQAGRVMT